MEAKLTIGRSPRGTLAWLVALVVVALAVVAGGARLALAQDPGPPVDVGPPQDFITADEVLAALQVAGLNVQDVRREPIGGSPGAAPGSEQDAFTFLIDTATASHPVAGRIMVFPSGQALKAKADWGRRIGSTFIQHRNVLVWLDSDVDAQTSARFHQAINGMR
jgi:hypothetical protein